MFMDEPPGQLDHRPERAGGPSVDVEGLAKRYGRRVAVEGLALALQPGQVFGLVGGNGGGKTTTLRILAGLLKPDRGHGHVLGFDLLRGAGEIRRHVGYMSQRLSLYGDLSVAENLRFRAQVYGLNRPRAAAEAVMHDFDLTQYNRTPAGRLSGGWARRLQLAASLIHSPRLLLLDEPTAGLDAVSRQEVWRLIRRTAHQGAGVIVSTHDLAEAEWCTYAAFLSEGRVVATGTPEQVALRAPAIAFLVSGTGTHRLAQSIDAIPGVLASYPQGASLRVIAEAGAEDRLASIARTSATKLDRVGMRLEDAALVFCKAPSRSGA